jgi:glyoxylase-like metal-dependent hydrolase (beta-lactamase superfamily II)
MNSITTLDMNWIGRPRAIAAALLRSNSVNAIVDPGPASTVDTLRAELAKSGLRVQDLQYVFLTHIHLDHAGATGTLVRENPRLRVYVHSRGLQHVVDPSKLLSSAERLWGAELRTLFGETLPVPMENLVALEGGEKIDFGGRALDVVYTPGHASHHVTYFDGSEGVAFVGDTAGISIEGDPFVLPATPPPDVDIELWDASLRAIGDLQAKRLFLTHFGFAEEPRLHLENYRKRLQLWSDLAAKSLTNAAGDDQAIEWFRREVSADAAKSLSPEKVEHYNFTGSFHLSWLGLARYHRKKMERQRAQG